MFRLNHLGTMLSPTLKQQSIFHITEEKQISESNGLQVLVVK